MDRAFLDSNVLLYLLSADAAKADRVEQLIDAGGTISVQVLNEVANVARRKLALPWPDVRAFLHMLRELLEVVPLTVETTETGLNLAARHGFSIYDAMIVASAASSNCNILWSEDMHHGFVVPHGPKVLNPFS